MSGTTDSDTYQPPLNCSTSTLSLVIHLFTLYTRFIYSALLVCLLVSIQHCFCQYLHVLKKCNFPLCPAQNNCFMDEQTAREMSHTPTDPVPPLMELAARAALDLNIHWNSAFLPLYIKGKQTPAPLVLRQINLVCCTQGCWVVREGALCVTDRSSTISRAKWPSRLWVCSTGSLSVSHCVHLILNNTANTRELFSII